MSHRLHKKIISVKTLLSEPSLSIPVYQRPYKWSEKNLINMMRDIQSSQNKSAYRLGTIVFFERNDTTAENKVSKSDYHLEIVDGQQRTITLMLIVRALLTSDKWKSNSNDFDELRQSVNNFLDNQKFKSDISISNIRTNYQLAKRLVSAPDFTENNIHSFIYFLLYKCELVTFVLDDISECFQFFDSQNARGKDLEPHDLLKAYHLREFPITEESLKLQSVSGWESIDIEDLSKLFACYLYRIKRWSKGDSARYFTKNEIDAFKGVNLSQSSHLSFAQHLSIVHHYVDEFNGMYHRKIDGFYTKYPFQLDQNMINGRRFFEMTAHYYHLVETVICTKSMAPVKDFFGVKLNGNAPKIFETLASYQQRHRTGDKYVLELFQCALIFYIDKFGVNEISLAIEKIFIWAYSLRIRNKAVYFSSIDNHVLADNIFKHMSHSLSPNQALQFKLEVLSNLNNKNDSAEENELVKLFKGMHYYE